MHTGPCPVQHIHGLRLRLDGRGGMCGVGFHERPEPVLQVKFYKSCARRVKDTNGESKRTISVTLLFLSLPVHTTSVHMTLA